jgi:lambda family phage portal protein
LVQKKLRKPSVDMPVPIQFRLLEAEHLVEGNQSLPDGGELYRGIHFDADNRRVAYRLWNRHPGDYGRQAPAGMRHADVPASEISHVFEPLRPGQARGVTDLTAVLMRLHSLDNFDDSVLFRQEVANLFAGFITKPAQTHQRLDPITGLPAKLDDDGFTPIASLEPGSMQELLPGEEVEFAEPPGAGNDYAPFMRQQLMAIAAAVDMPYEVLTGDLRDVSDRALRVILTEFRRRLEQRQWNIFIPLHCRWIWSQWLDAVALSGVVHLPDYRTNKRDYMRVRWVPQGWPYIHPLQDVQAQRLKIRSGLGSRSAANLEQGEDPEAVDEQIAADNARADRLGLMFDSDPRQRDNAGEPTNPEKRKQQ